MFAVTGITGQVGGAVARRLLDQGKGVRAIVRDRAKAGPWAQRDCEVAVAPMTDADALAAAFADVEGVFVLIPPTFDPSPGFPEVRAVIDALVAGFRQATPSRVICLSTIGAQATEPNLLSQLGMVEAALGRLDPTITFLRAAWFMENAAGDLQAARTTGVFESYLQPLDRPVPMVATADVSQIAAELLTQTRAGRRIVELEGPRRVTAVGLGAAMADALGRDVAVRAVPRGEWADRFHAAGARNPGPRARMIDGFNEGWIEFEGGVAGSIKGTTDIQAVMRDLANPGRKG